MRHKTEVERSAIVKAVRDLLMVAFDEQIGNVINWGMVSDATSEATPISDQHPGRSWVWDGDDAGIGSPAVGARC